MAEPTQRNAVLSCLLLVQKIEKFSMTIVEEDRKKVFREKKTYISWCDQRGNNNPWTSVLLA